MFHYLIHYVAHTPDHDYGRLEETLSATEAVQLTEELWLVVSETSAGELATDLFRDRPQSDRFLILELKSVSGFSAANLMEDPRQLFSALVRDPALRHVPSVKIYAKGRPPRELS